MAYWLLKTEPSAYSFDDLEKENKTRWDGVRNPTALQHIRTMQPGDDAVIYHSGDERQAVGLARVVTAAYPDPAQNDPKLAVADIQLVKRFQKPVPLATMKSDPLFAESPLVRISRLSVVPLSEAQFQAVESAGRA